MTRITNLDHSKRYRSNEVFAPRWTSLRASSGVIYFGGQLATRTRISLFGRRESPDRFVGRFDDGNQDRTCRRKEWRRVLGKTCRGKTSLQATSAKRRSKVNSQGNRREWRGDKKKYSFGLPESRGACWGSRLNTHSLSSAHKPPLLNLMATIGSCNI